VDPRAGLDDVENSKFLLPPGLELRPPVVQPVAIPTTLSQLLLDDARTTSTYEEFCLVGYNAM
jgi:hypothetical protein